MTLKIALCTYATKPRGSVIHTLELAEALAALGHQVCIYALDKDGMGFDRSLACPVALIPSQPAPESIDALIIQRIQEFVNGLSQSSETYDIYHAQDCITANALLQFRQQGHSITIVRTVHHVEAFQSIYLQQCQERSIRQVDCCLCVSDYWQAILRQDYQIKAARVLNGVNLQRFSSQPSGHERQIHQQYGLTGYPVFLTVGGIEPRKNSLRLLQAFAQVLVHCPSAQLMIAGGATLFDYQPYRQEFFQLAQQLQIEIGVSLILPGVIPDAVLPVLYRCADAFVFPSLTEGWGLVVLEAIASGLPVILSDQPPFTEFLSSNQAIFVDSTAPAAIAAAMLTMLQPAVSQALMRQSQAVLADYNWLASAQLHVEQYQKLLCRAKVGPQP